MEILRRKINYYECDRMGITHHSNYIRFMEEARIELLDKFGYGFERMEAEGVSPGSERGMRIQKTHHFPRRTGNRRASGGTLGP